MHTENSTSWGQAEADALLANSLRHRRRDHVNREACIVLWGTAILVRAVVRSHFKELIEKAPIRAVNLNTIKARTLNCIARRSSIRSAVSSLLSGLGYSASSPYTSYAMALLEVEHPPRRRTREMDPHSSVARPTQHVQVPEAAGIFTILLHVRRPLPWI